MIKLQRFEESFIMFGPELMPYGLQVFHFRISLTVYHSKIQ